MGWGAITISTTPKTFDADAVKARKDYLAHLKAHNLDVPSESHAQIDVAIAAAKLLITSKSVGADVNEAFTVRLSGHATNGHKKPGDGIECIDVSVIASAL